MQVIPAIDLRGGACVRLRQGDFERETQFGADPLQMADRWRQAGARRLHLVDLDGAKSGAPRQLPIIRAIVQSLDIPCQLGGGLRDDRSVVDALAAGLDRVIIGTQALRDPTWFRALANRHPGRVILGLDARDGMVATDGWLADSRTSAIDLARQFDDSPLAAIIYTDIARDGMLEGPNLAATAELARVARVPVIASGGVGSLEDLRRLAELSLAGCIVGRALYDGRFTLQQAIAAACESEAPSSAVS